MSESVMVAIVSTVGLVMSGVLVELIRARKRADTVVSAVTPSNGDGSMRDVLDNLIVDVRELRVEQNRHGNRLAGIEAVLAERSRRK